MRLTARSNRPAPPGVLLAHAILIIAALAPPATPQVGRSDPGLAIATWRGFDVVAGEVLVQFGPGASGPQQAATAERLGCRALGAVTPTLARVALPAGAHLDAWLARWRAQPGVQSVQPNAIHRPVLAPAAPAPLAPAPGVPSDPKWPLQWGLAKVHADLAWDSYQGDPAAVVAVIDSGVDADHPDLDAHYAWGWDFASGDPDPDDGSGHGTHCCGVAAAETGNALGVAGVAPACRFAAYRCGDQTFPSSALVAAINDARGKGALVLSMSWGSYYNDPAIKAALQAARDAGCVLVAAAGNDNVSTPFYPAAHAFVIAVAASTSTDEKASFSNFGSWVDVAAPGQSIHSTWKAASYQYASGTSMATPLVAGTADLLYARLGGVRSPVNAALVRAAIETSAVPVGSWVTSGRVDVQAALLAIAPPPAPHVAAVAPPAVPALGGTTLTVSGSGFTGATSVAIGGQPVAPFTAVDDTTLQLVAPPAPSLGTGQLAVSGPGGTSNSAAFDWVPTDPPQVIVPASVAQGAACTWRCGGGAHDGFTLLASIDDATFVHAGQAILQRFVVLQTGHLDGAGLEELSGTLPAGTAGITFHSQLVTKGPALKASAIVTTTITP